MGGHEPDAQFFRYGAAHESEKTGNRTASSPCMEMAQPNSKAEGQGELGANPLISTGYRLLRNLLLT